MSESYTALKTMFETAIENQDGPMLKALIEHIVPLSTPEDQLEVRNKVAVNAYNSNVQWIKDLFIKSYPPRDDSAVEHLMGYLQVPWRERSLIQESADSLNENFGNVLLSAFFKGDVEIVDALLKAGKPAPSITYNSQTGRMLADNIEVKLQFEDMKWESGSLEFKGFIDLLCNAVMAGGSDLDRFVGEFFSRGGFRDVAEKTEPKPFTSLIPKLDAGVLHNPELLIAFAERQKSNALKKVHSHIVAYVKPEEVAGISEIEPYTVVRRAMCAGTEVSFEDIARPEAVTEVINLNNGQDPGTLVDLMPVTHLSIGLNGDHLSKTFLNEASCRVKMLTESQFMGLDIPAGYTIALMDVKCLEYFEVGKVDPKSMAESLEYAESYFPAELLTTYSGSYVNHVVRERSKVSAQYLLNLFDHAAQSDDANKIFSSFPDQFWINIFNRYSELVSAHSILAAHSRFGLTQETTRGFILEHDDIDILYDGGYSFANDGAGCIFKTPINDWAKPEYYRKLISMNGWPSDMDRPADCVQALKLAVRNKFNDPYRLLVEKYGPEAAVKAAKTQAQFTRVTEIFSREQLQPFFDQIPLPQVGAMFRNELGV